MRLGASLAHFQHRRWLNIASPATKSDGKAKIAGQYNRFRFTVPAILISEDGGRFTPNRPRSD